MPRRTADEMSADAMMQRPEFSKKISDGRGGFTRKAKLAPLSKSDAELKAKCVAINAKSAVTTEELRAKLEAARNPARVDLNGFSRDALLAMLSEILSDLRAPEWNADTLEMISRTFTGRDISID